MSLKVLVVCYIIASRASVNTLSLFACRLFVLCNHIISKQGECVHILKIPCLQTVPFLRSLTLQAGQVDIHFSKMPRNPYRLLVKYFPQTPEKSERILKKFSPSSATVAWLFLKWFFEFYNLHSLKLCVKIRNVIIQKAKWSGDLWKLLLMQMRVRWLTLPLA